MEKTQREKSLHFVPRLTSSSRRVENEKKKRRKKDQKKKKTSKWQGTQFHSWPSKWASNFPRCINEPVIKLPIRDSIERNKGGKPVSSIPFNRELRGRGYASDYVESRWSHYRSPLFHLIHHRTAGCATIDRHSRKRSFFVHVEWRYI